MDKSVDGRDSLCRQLEHGSEPWGTGISQCEGYEAITLDEFSGLFKVAKRTAAYWIKARKLGYIKVGRSVRILPRHIEEFVAKFNINSAGKALPLNSGKPVAPKVYLTIGTATTQVNYNA